MSDLAELTVLAIDCQATRGNPRAGHLIEIGWVKTNAAYPFDHEITAENARSHLVRIAKRTLVPRQFFQITGITPDEQKEASSRKIIWHNLYQAAKQPAAENQGMCPAVIHYKRYEEPYLRQLHQEFAPDERFPFQIVCTHEIIQKLYPGLPRKSLRAVAGYFGYSLPEYRRSLHHVVATAFIWSHVVNLLEEQEKITTVPGFLDWLHKSPTPAYSAKRARIYPMKKASRQGLPDKPGIYRMYRSTGDLLYIGKAKSLKNRVNSYFHVHGRHAEHILEMLSQAQNLTTSVTWSALEAAVRESDEIKHHSPPYNRALRQDERELLFYSKNLKRKQTKPDIHCPIGPISSNIRMESLATLIDALNGKIKKFSSRSMETVLLIPPEYAPDKSCFKLGLDAFRNEYTYERQSPILLRHLMKWGALFWKEKLAEREQDQTRESEEERECSLEDEDREQIEEGWTPERVFKALKRSIRLCSFQMRRARWYCRLSESSLIWPGSGISEGHKHILVIESGATSFIHSDLMSPETKIPSGHKKSLLERLQNFDVATYDRMRIVTTEMRRIIQEGRNLELCFYPGISLKTTQLKEMLKWV
jgi:DNA polymerase-3 subunit epsilon